VRTAAPTHARKHAVMFTCAAAAATRGHDARATPRVRTQFRVKAQGPTQAGSKHAPLTADLEASGSGR
jgi:hypothetical protein